MASFKLRCVECGATYAEEPTRLVCDACSAQQRIGGETRGVLEVVIDHLPDRWIDDFGSSEFLTGFLPINDAGHLPPIPVGGTPLIKTDALAAAIGVEYLWVKDDTRNPSGSTKDRASQLVVAKASEYRIDTIAAASTGNAATALAAMAAAAGKKAVAFVPAKAPEAKLIQMLSYGINLIPVLGTYDDAFELCLAACQAFGWYNRNTALNPFTIEGKKTMALEIAHQIRGWGKADVVLVPVGDGVIISGIAKGFADLRRAGLLESVPRLIAVQPSRSASIATALRAGTVPVPDPMADSVADSLNVLMPRNAFQCVKMVQASGGAGVIVEDRDILDSIRVLASSTGVFAEPAGAISVAGLRQAVADGIVGADERIVLAVTGSGLKDVDAAARAVRRPDPVEPTLEMVEKMMN